MKGYKGFTLIELVVVIVILGILAVTAAPKFLDLQSDARNAALQGLQGSLNSATIIVYAKAAIEGIETQAGGTGIDVNGITINFGYPTANDDGIGEMIIGISDWTVAVDSGNSIYYAATKDSELDTVAKIIATNCYVSYKNALIAVGTPEVALINSGLKC